MSVWKLPGLRKFANDFTGKIYLRPFITALRSLKILEVDYGHFLSSQSWSAIDRMRKPIPWFSYPSIQYLSGLDFSDKIVFEYGIGNSTLFWVNKCKKLIAVENNKKWYENVVEKIRKSQKENVSIYLVQERSKYIKTINDHNYKYDAIFIDGFYRNECAKEAVKKLKRNGMIILDNSDWFPNICKYLRKNNLIQIDFTGFGPINPYTTTTSLFLTRKFEFAPKSGIQPTHQLGGIKHLKG